MAITSAEANAIRMLTLDEARTRKLTAEAELAEIELAKAKGVKAAEALKESRTMQ